MRRVITSIVLALVTTAAAGTASADPGQRARPYQTFQQRVRSLRYAERYTVRVDAYAGWKNAEARFGNTAAHYHDDCAGSEDEYLDEIQPLIPLGATVDVQFGSSWWKAMVLDQRGDYYLVNYLGYSATWNEWVRIERIRPTFAITPGVAPELRNVYWNDAPVMPPVPE